MFHASCIKTFHAWLRSRSPNLSWCACQLCSGSAALLLKANSDTFLKSYKLFVVNEFTSFSDKFAPWLILGGLNVTSADFDKLISTSVCGCAVASVLVCFFFLQSRGVSFRLSGVDTNNFFLNRKLLIDLLA